MITPFQQLFFKISQGIKVKEHKLQKSEQTLYMCGDLGSIAPKEAWYSYSEFDVERLKPKIYHTPSMYTIMDFFDKKEQGKGAYEVAHITPFWGQAFYLLGDYGNDFYSHPMQVYAPCVISEDWQVECGLICYNLETNSFFVKDYMVGQIPPHVQENLTIQDIGGKRPYAFHPELKLVHLNRFVTDSPDGCLSLTPAEFTESVTL